MTPEWAAILLIAGPLALVALCYLWPACGRWASTAGLAASVPLLCWLAPAATAPLPWRHHLGGWQPPLGIALHADGLSLLMLAMTTAVGMGIALYAGIYLAHGHAHENRYYWPLWNAVWAALNGLFLSGDIFNMYVMLELLGLSAVALAALGGGKAALGATIRYLMTAMAGALFYLLAVGLIYSRYATVDWLELSTVVGPEPVARIAFGFAVVGLLVKAAIFPGHFWLPPAHANALSPVSALLSSVVVKAGIYLLLRLWFWVFSGVGTAPAGTLVATLGAVAIVWGSLVALRQQRLKLLIAYSTIAQLGYLMLIYGLATGPLAGRLAWEGTVYLLISHSVAKAAIFLAAGILMIDRGHDQLDEMEGLGERLPMTVFVIAVGGISLMGLPPSGGFVGKWLLLQATFQSGQWWWTLVLGLGGLLAAAYIFRIMSIVLRRHPDLAPPKATVPAGLQTVALLLVLITVLLGLIPGRVLGLLAPALPASVTTIIEASP